MLNDKELSKITGGVNITAALLSAVAKGITTIMNLGQTLGSSIRRLLKKNYC